MQSDDLDERKRAIQQLVVELLAPYHARLQPLELAWPSPHPSSHDLQLWLTWQHEAGPRVVISFTRSQLETAVSPEDVASCARLREYIWGNVRPLIH